MVMASLLVLRSFWADFHLFHIFLHMCGEGPSVQKKGAYIMKCAFSEAAASVMLSHAGPD
jgi:hypothetical protein